MNKLTDDEVSDLYNDYPEIEDPNYPFKKFVSIHDNETTIIDMVVGKKKYRVLSSPLTGDIWYKK